MIEFVISKKTEQIRRALAPIEVVNQIPLYFSSSVGFKQFMAVVEIELEIFQKEQ